VDYGRLSSVVQDQRANDLIVVRRSSQRTPPSAYVELYRRPTRPGEA